MTDVRKELDNVLSNDKALTDEEEIEQELQRLRDKFMPSNAVSAESET